MFAWWNDLSTLAQVFVCIAAPATLVLIIQTVLMLIGIGDHGFDGDFADGGIDIDTDTDIGEGLFGHDAPDGDIVDAFDGLHLFSVRGIIAFFVVFGWVGVLLDLTGMHPALTLLIAGVCGFAMMVLIALLYRWVMRLQSDGTVDIRNALGVSGTVYLTVPAARSASGKVNLTVQGTYCEYQAVTDSDAPIETGKEITVIGISGQNTLVVKQK